MKVKSLYPIIISENPKETISFYGNLGFGIKHDFVAENGHHVYVINNDDMEIEIIEGGGENPMFPKGLLGFRMNVSDIDEAYKELKENGNEIVMTPVESEMAKGMIVHDDQGIHITIMQHIKK